MSATGNDFYRAYCARKTICEMLIDRGFSVEEKDLRQSPSELKERLGITNDIDSSRHKFLLQTSHKDNEEDKIIVFFPTDKLGIKTVKEYVEIMQSSCIYHAIIVTQNQSTAQARKALEQCAIPMSGSSHNLRFERFQEAELQVNITRHVLIPKHEILSDDEKREVMNKCGLQLNQFPRILKDDPVARYYGMSVGQIVKITRAGDYVTYRVVV
jgi:DNA-directed RNA polymerases I, II, and III subunit RPABC1